MEQDDLKIKHNRVADLVVEQLMDLIMSGRIHMGQKINTEDIAQQFGVSRMPVREALKMLERQGLVESIPYVGCRVVKFTIDDVHQIYIMRKALEPIAGYYACQKVIDEDIKKIVLIQRDVEAEMQREHPDAKQIFICNRKFHFTMYNVSGMDKLCDMIQKLWDNLAFYKLIYGLTYVSDKNASDEMIVKHREYIDALVARDSELLQQKLIENLDDHLKNVPKMLFTYMDSSQDK